MEADAPLKLTDLPLPLLEDVLLLLDKRTICALAKCSLRLRRIANGDALWRRLCERCFPHTDAQCWLSMRADTSQQRSLGVLLPPLPPDNYRCVPCCGML